eukprot:gb/GECG01009362.1/.p1 GENE.gb/GECG01009362.1/~~gb/GECG01009362.1/.p1  ORF type:complete len:686 (+),score=63.05 gb/GECG01009362.1/:1-2058(+)
MISTVVASQHLVYKGNKMERLLAGVYGPICGSCSSVFSPNSDSCRSHLIQCHKESVSRNAYRGWLDAQTFEEETPPNRLARVDSNLPILNGRECCLCNKVFAGRQGWNSHKREHAVAANPTYRCVKAQAHPGNCLRAVRVACQDAREGPRFGRVRFPDASLSPDRRMLERRYEGLVKDSEIYRTELVRFYMSLGLHADVSRSNEEYYAYLRSLFQEVHCPSFREDSQRWYAYKNTVTRIRFLCTKGEELLDFVSDAFRRGIMMHTYGDGANTQRDGEEVDHLQRMSTVAENTKHKYVAEVAQCFVFLCPGFFEKHPQFSQQEVPMHADEQEDTLFQSVCHTMLEHTLFGETGKLRNGLILAQRSKVLRYFQGRVLDKKDGEIFFRPPGCVQHLAASLLFVLRHIWMLHSVNGVKATETGAAFGQNKLIVKVKYLASAARQMGQRMNLNIDGSPERTEDGALLGYRIGGDIISRPLLGRLRKKLLNKVREEMKMFFFGENDGMNSDEQEVVALKLVIEGKGVCEIRDAQLQCVGASEKKPLNLRISSVHIGGSRTVGLQEIVDHLTTSPIRDAVLEDFFPLMMNMFALVYVTAGPPVRVEELRRVVFDGDQDRSVRSLPNDPRIFLAISSKKSHRRLQTVKFLDWETSRLFLLFCLLAKWVYLEKWQDTVDDTVAPTSEALHRFRD